MIDAPVIAKYYVRFHDKPEVKPRMPKEPTIVKLLTQAKRAALKLERDLKDRETTLARLTATIAALNEENLSLGGRKEKLVTLEVSRPTPKEPNEKPVYPIPNPLALDTKDLIEQLKKVQPINLL